MKKYIFITIVNLIVFSCLAIQAQDFKIKIDNKDRSYLIRLPQNYDAIQYLPLQIFLHGGGFTKEEGEAIYGFTEHADTSGYILVYPQGLNNSWSRENDFVFISSLIDTLCNKYKIDKQRVYVSGHSAGCVLVNILACELSYKIAAFGDVGGFMLNNYSKFYKPAQPVPYVKIHGTGDNIIPYAGDAGFISVDSVISFWKHNNKALSLISTINMPDIVKSDNSNVIKYTYGHDNSEIVFYKVVNGGHDAPDWKGNNEMGYTNRDINTPEVLWDFFNNHKLSGAKVTYIANAGFLIESDNKKVLIDALFSNGYGEYSVTSQTVRENIIDGKSPFNAVDLSLVTHEHDDHFNASFVANQLYNNKNTTLIGPENVESLLKAQSGYSSFSNRVIGLTPDWNKQTDTTINGITVKILRMHHDNSDFENNAYLFELDSLKVLHIGDYTGDVLSEMETFNLKNENIDIALINYYCYMNGKETLNKVKAGINAKHTILYHISNDDLEMVMDSSSKLTNTAAYRSTFESSFFTSDTSFFINKAPVLTNPIPDTVAYIGQKSSFRLANSTFTDNYNDFLNYEAKLSSGNALPNWLTFNTNSKYFTGNPPVEENLSIKVTVTDFAGASASDVFILKVKKNLSAIEIIDATNKFLIFPNPASSSIHIKTSSQLFEICNYQLFDASGRLVKQNRLATDLIDISELKSGIYMLNLISGKEVFGKKIIIE